jgi:hypothetical protein
MNEEKTAEQNAIARAEQLILALRKGKKVTKNGKEVTSIALNCVDEYKIEGELNDEEIIDSIMTEIFAKVFEDLMRSPLSEPDRDLNKHATELMDDGWEFKGIVTCAEGKTTVVLEKNDVIQIIGDDPNDELVMHLYEYVQ